MEAFQCGPTNSAYRIRQKIIFTNLKCRFIGRKFCEMNSNESSFDCFSTRFYDSFVLTSSPKWTRIVSAILNSIPFALKMSIDLNLCLKHSRHHFRLIFRSILRYFYSEKLIQSQDFVFYSRFRL